MTKNGIILSTITKKPSKLFNKKRIYIAIFIGLTISGYLLYKEISQTNFTKNISQVNWTFTTFWFLFLAMCMMVLHDFAYVVRLRILTDNKLSWQKSLNVILMWEFASAVSPGVVGGSAVAMFILNKEKIPLGKATALVVTSTLLDNLFYLIIVPLVVFLVGMQSLIPINYSHFIILFWLGYGVVLLVTILLSISLFIYPKLIKNLLLFVFKLPFIKKYNQNVQKVARDIKLASKYIKNKPVKYWFQLMGSTILSWSARFLVVNFILMAFTTLDFYDNILIFGRQLIMWLILLISPTPGGSGVAEYLFTSFLADFIRVSSLVVVLSILWRIISYYPYLFIGSILLPRWLKKN